MNLPYWIVDAFTDRLFAGNPAAVVLPDAPLPTDLMQSIAAENNLSETAFATPEADGHRLRWFTPTMEIDLCGHATLATSFVLAMRGAAGPFRFHTRSGVLTATLLDKMIELDFPAGSFQLVPAPPDLAAVLGCMPVEVFAEGRELSAVLESAAAVAALRPDFAAIRALPGGVLTVTAQGGPGADITSRYFAPAYGIDEDPVTGGMHTRVVPYWAEKLGKTTLVCHQASARGGTMTCTLAGDRVRMAGSAMLYAKGELVLP